MTEGRKPPMSEALRILNAQRAVENGRGEEHRRLDHMLRVQEDRDSDWKLIRGEFPNQFPEFDDDDEFQARQGEVPPVQDIVNFGKKADAGGFEPRRRGW